MRCVFALLPMLSAGCLFFGGGGGDPAADAGADASGGDDVDAAPFVDPYPTVRALKQGSAPVGTRVTLKNVVITAVWPCQTQPCRDDLFVTDAVETSGEATTDLGMLMLAPADFAFDPHVIGAIAGDTVEGDRVEVSGTVALHTFPGSPVPMKVLIDGYVRSPDGRAQARVPAVALEALVSHAGLAPYEGMLVRGEAVPIGTTPWAGGLPIFGGGFISGQLTALLTLDRGSCASLVAGVAVQQQFPTLLPRLQSDLDETPDTPCPPFSPEFHTGECTDGIDNDWDEAADCEAGECTQACVLLDPGVASTTVTAVQTAASPPTSIKLDDAVVIAVNPREQGGDYWELWLSDPMATSAQHGGILLLYYKHYDDFRALPVGTLVDVVGEGREYTSSFDGSSLTWRRLEYALVEPGGTGAAPAPAAVTATQLTTTASAWEGQIVTLQNHRLVSGFNPAGFGLLSDGVSTILISTRLADLVIVPGTCFASVTGVIAGGCGNRPATNPCVVLAPRSTADLVQGSACP